MKKSILPRIKYLEYTLCVERENPFGTTWADYRLIESTDEKQAIIKYLDIILPDFIEAYELQGPYWDYDDSWNYWRVEVDYSLPDFIIYSRQGDHIRRSFKKKLCIIIKKGMNNVCRTIKRIFKRSFT